MEEELLKIITKDIMEDYETIRQSGVTNMFDFFQVTRIAKKWKMKELAKLTRDQYGELLGNFGKLMKYYNVKQK